VLDALRHGTLAPGSATLAVLFTASDVLADLVAMARAGEAVPAGYGDECRAALERLIGRGESCDGGEDVAADIEGHDSAPVRADDFDASNKRTGERCYSISFRPKSELLNGQDPLFLLRELRTLGTLDLVAQTEALPPLAELSPDVSYIGWRGTLRTSWTRQDIERVFAFVADKCDLEVTELDSADTGMQVAAGFDAGPDQVLELAPPLVPEPMPPADALEAQQPLPPRRQRGRGGQGARAAATPGATTIRVERDKIDRVVTMVGEIVIAQAMLSQVVGELAPDVAGRLSQPLEDVFHHTRELKNGVMSMRAQPVRTVFQRMTRLVRKLSAQTATKVLLEIKGEST
jgi:two-component system chemotaxis sensor kinase CheA